MNRVFAAGGIIVIVVGLTVIGLLLTDDVTGLPEAEAARIYRAAVASFSPSDTCLVLSESMAPVRGLTDGYMDRWVPEEHQWSVAILRSDSTTRELSSLLGPGYLLGTEEERKARRAKRIYDYIRLSEIGYDREREYAAVACTYVWGYTLGSNYLLLLKRTERGWEVTDRIHRL